jgi:hypothetical protein
MIRGNGRKKVRLCSDPLKKVNKNIKIKEGDNL